MNDDELREQLRHTQTLSDEKAQMMMQRAKDLLTGEWVVDKTNAKQRRVLHYWLTIVWFTIGFVLWVLLRDALWFVGFMSLYAIWITHLAGWAAETPVEHEDNGDTDSRGS